MNRKRGDGRVVSTVSFFPMASEKPRLRPSAISGPYRIAPKAVFFETRVGLVEPSGHMAAGAMSQLLLLVLVFYFQVIRHRELIGVIPGFNVTFH